MGVADRRIAFGQECAYQMISLGNVNHCVDVCSEVGWVGFCRGGGGCMAVCGEEGGRLAGRLAGSRDPPPRRAEGEENL